MPPDEAAPVSCLLTPTVSKGISQRCSSMGKHTQLMGHLTSPEEVPNIGGQTWQCSGVSFLAQELLTAVLREPYGMLEV